MFGLSLEKITAIVQGDLCGVQEQGKGEPLGASVDTRMIGEGELFFALKGEKLDGHDFLREAQKRGALAAVVSRMPAHDENIKIPLIVVDSVMKALQQTALAMRKSFRGPVIAITGSTGKTSTKDMLWSILAEKGPLLKNPGNYNNELGLPLTLLSLRKEHWAVVLEMGMRALGEIDFLARCSEPEYGIITNIGHTHQELLGSVEKIARAKAELFAHLPKEGGIVLNSSDKEKLKPWLDTIKSKVCWVGTQEDRSELWAEDISENSNPFAEPELKFNICSNMGKEASARLPVWGRHNVINALLASGMARQLGLSWEEITAGLGKIALSAGRTELKALQNRKIMLIDDTYNANPDSVAAALDTLFSFKSEQTMQRSVAVLGNMYELGSFEQAGHLLVGEKAKKTGVSILVTVGQQALDIAKGAQLAGMDPGQIRTCRNNQEALDCLKTLLHDGDLVLIKGSRGVKMEEIVFGLMNW